MPVQQKGFLFKHFEKIACGVVGVLLVVAVAYAFQRTGADQVNELTSRIQTLTSRLEDQMDDPPPERDIPNLVEQWRASRAVSEPGEVREIFWYPWPVYYPERRLAVGEEYVLEFREPLAPRPPVRVEDEEAEGEGDVITRIVHPVGMDHSKVQVYTGNVSYGRAMIVGTVGNRLHRMPLVVDETVRERAEPPVDVAAEAQRGGLVISWMANEANTEGVIVEGYEVFRKRARDVTGQFRKVGEINVKAGESGTRSSRTGREAGRDEMRPGGGMEPRPEEESEEESEERFTWTDPIRSPGSVDRDDGTDQVPESGVQPEEAYLYKVRTVAQESEPPTSVFSETVRATALPTVDFKFTGQRGDQLRFEVRVYRDGRVYEESCENRVGEEIGIFVEEEANVQNFLTGCYLVDFHPDAIRQQPFARSRVVFVNRRGRVMTRWRDETRVQDLWDWEPEDEETTGRGGRMPGGGEPPGGGYRDIGPQRR